MCTCYRLHTLCIAKVGIWGMHLAQVQRQVESASITVTPVPHHASHMPEYGAQQIIGRHVMRPSHCRVVEPILQASRIWVLPHSLLGTQHARLVGFVYPMLMKHTLDIKQ